MRDYIYDKNRDCIPTKVFAERNMNKYYEIIKGKESKKEIVEIELDSFARKVNRAIKEIFDSYGKEKFLVDQIMGKRYIPIEYEEFLLDYLLYQEKIKPKNIALFEMQKINFMIQFAVANSCIDAEDIINLFNYTFKTEALTLKILYEEAIKSKICYTKAYNSKKARISHCMIIVDTIAQKLNLADELYEKIQSFEIKIEIPYEECIVYSQLSTLLKEINRLIRDLLMVKNGMEIEYRP